MSELKGHSRLGRADRLRGKETFGRIFREGNGLRRGQLVAKYCTKRSDASSVAAAFVVRRSAGTAVRRNRLRRLVREAYRLERSNFLGMLPEGTVLELVLLWSGSPEQALRPQFHEVRRDMDDALRGLAHRLRKILRDARSEP